MIMKTTLATLALILLAGCVSEERYSKCTAALDEAVDTLKLSKGVAVTCFEILKQCEALKSPQPIKPKKDEDDEIKIYLPVIK